jgi:hypothetical protein
MNTTNDSTVRNGYYAPTGTPFNAADHPPAAFLNLNPIAAEETYQEPPIDDFSFGGAIDEPHDYVEPTKQPSDVDKAIALRLEQMEREKLEYEKEQWRKENNRNSHNATLDDDKHYCSVDLLAHVDDKHLLKQLCLSIVSATALPASTVFLNGLGAFSSMSTRAWRVNYQHSGSVPIGLFVTTEQPTGSAKSRCLNTFLQPFQKAHRKHAANCLELIKNLGDSDEDKEEKERLQEVMNVTFIATNSTPEALDESLHTTNGFFSAVSSEQGLFNSLLGLSYGDGKANNNDLLLNAFNGDYVATMRKGRAGYRGFVGGGVTLFAQNGSVETILNQSNGTGLSERFLMLAEPHNLGNRDWTKPQHIDDWCVTEYAKICEPLASKVFMNPTDYNDLPALMIDDDGWRLIYNFRNKIEPNLKDGGRYSHGSLRGAAGKVDIQIMKIAANLHLLKGINPAPKIISNDLVNAAIGIVNDLLEAHLGMLKDKGVAGDKAEWQAIIKYLSGKKGVKMREITNSLKSTSPFKTMTGAKNAAIKSAVAEMLNQGVLKMTEQDVYSIG